MRKSKYQTYEEILGKDSPKEIAFRLLFGLANMAVLLAILLLHRQLIELVFKIIQKSNEIIVWIVFVILGIFGYWSRFHFRFSYGLVEAAVGAATVWNVIDSIPQEINATDYYFYCFPMLAGLYIIVRGFDNMGKGAKGKSIEKTWRVFFGDEAVK